MLSANCCLHERSAMFMETISSVEREVDAMESCLLATRLRHLARDSFFRLFVGMKYLGTLGIFNMWFTLGTNWPHSGEGFTE